MGIERGDVPEQLITIVGNELNLNRLRPVEPDLDLRRKGNEDTLTLMLQPGREGERL